MKVLIGTAAMAAALALANAAAAQEPPEALTWMVLNEINGNYFDRSEPMNRPEIVAVVPEGMIHAVDVSHDGVADWLIDYDPAGSSWCGTGGCLKTLYVSHGDQYVMAFDEQALDFQIAERDGETRIFADVHHTFCVPDNWDCQFGYAWDADLMKLVERPNAAGVTLLTGGGMSPLGFEADPAKARDDLPEALSQWWYGTRLTCRDYSDAGFETRRATTNEVADLNGDGVRDWIVEPPLSCPEDPDEDVSAPGFRVWLSSPDGAFSEAYASEHDRWPSIDIASSPAFLIDNPGCGYGDECPNVRLRWDAAAKRFVEAR